MERASLSKFNAVVTRGSPVELDAGEVAHHSHSRLEAWLRRRIGNIDHEKRVLQIATAFHDMTRDLHGLGQRAMWSLSAAALIHDVGRSIDDATHELVGAQLILADRHLDFSPVERRSLAYLTRYHRGPVPDLGEDDLLRPTDPREELLKVLGLLRAADTLDSRGLEPPRLLLMRRQRRLEIQCVVEHHSSRAAKTFCRRKKFKLMEQTIGCRIEVQVRNGDAKRAIT